MNLFSESILFQWSLRRLGHYSALCGGFLALGSKCATLSIIKIVCLHLGQSCRDTSPSSTGGNQNNLALQYGQVTTLRNGILTDRVMGNARKGSRKS